MGWSSIARLDVAPLEFLRSEFRESAGASCRMIALRQVGSVFYGAWERDAGIVGGEPAPRAVVGLVILTEGRKGGSFAWKIMDESMGPNESKCPAEILALLDAPAPGEWAAAWRARCLANLGAAPVGRGQMDLLAASGVA